MFLMCHVETKKYRSQKQCLKIGVKKTALALNSSLPNGDKKILKILKDVLHKAIYLNSTERETYSTHKYIINSLSSIA